MDTMAEFNPNGLHTQGMTSTGHVQATLDDPDDDSSSDERLRASMAMVSATTASVEIVLSPATVTDSARTAAWRTTSQLLETSVQAF